MQPRQPVGAVPVPLDILDISAHFSKAKSISLSKRQPEVAQTGFARSKKAASFVATGL